MNERIKQLAEQAGLSKATYWMNNAGEIHFEKLMSLQDDHTEEVKKFAELIVRECVKVAMRSVSDDEPKEAWYLIQEHFRVEE